MRSTRPILIVDEPQSTGRTADSAGRKIMRAMEPLATIGYSATHEFAFHPIYRLDAFDAHERGLVKSIEVDGARIQDAENRHCRSPAPLRSTSDRQWRRRRQCTN